MYKDSVFVSKAIYKVNILNKHIICQLQADKSSLFTCLSVSF